MRTIVHELEAAFRTAIAGAFANELNGADVDPIIVASQNEKFGDYQSNAAMSLAKTLKLKPRDAAEKINAAVGPILRDIATGTSIAGPGFINVRLNPKWLASRLDEARRDDDLGIEKTANPQTVVVEYSSPNIAKQMHVGHIRTTILGDALARILELLGHKVIRQNHIGDWGTQFGKVILSIWHLSRAEAIGDADWPKRMSAQIASVKNDPAARAALIAEVAAQHQKYLDADPNGQQFAQYLDRFTPRLDVIEPIYQFVSAVEEAPEAKQHFITDSKGNKASLADQSKVITSMLQQRHEQEIKAWQKVRDATLDACQQIYDRLGVDLKRSDVRGESEYDEDLKNVVDELLQLGIAEESEGAIVVFVDGKDKSPLIIEKSKGHGFLYATTDLAAIRYRARTLKADRVLYIVDARQSQHFRQVFEVAKRAGWGANTKYEHAAFGTILGADGKPMKTREGDNVKLAELLDEAESRALDVITKKNTELPEDKRKEIAHAIGIGAIKYADLSKDRTTDYIFAWDQMLSFDGNTAPYLQNAYVRIKSIFRKGGIDPKSVTSSITLNDPHELALAKHMLRIGEVIDVVARDLRPHVLCTFLFELAAKFHSFFEHCPVLQSGEPLKSSRLALCDATAKTLAKGLDLLGIEHPDQM